MHKSVPNGASHLLRNMEGEARQVPGIALDMDILSA